MPNNSQILLTALIVGAFFSYVVVYKGRKLPPGPPGLHLIESMLVWPSSQEWLTYTKWANTYGDIVYANLAGMNIIILNSLSTAKELLNKCGAYFSDWPHQHFANNIIGWKDSPMMCAASHPHFKPSWSMMHDTVGTPASLTKYIPMEEHETRCLLLWVMNNPDAAVSHFRRSLTLLSDNSLSWS